MEETLDTPVQENSWIHDSFRWWEKRRLLFNLLVGVSGLPALFIWFFEENGPGWLVLIPTTLYALTLNFLYCTGYLLECFESYYLEGRLNLKRLRWLFYVIGTGAIVLLNTTIGIVSYLASHQEF